MASDHVVDRRANASLDHMIAAVSYRQQDRGRRWNLIALVLAMVAVIVLIAVPMGSSITIDSAGESVSAATSLLGEEGPSVLFIPAAPLVIMGAPLLVNAAHARRRMRVTVAAALGLLVLLGALSIGVFFLPAWLSMVISAALSNPNASSSGALRHSGGIK